MPLKIGILCVLYFLIFLSAQSQYLKENFEHIISSNHIVDKEARIEFFFTTNNNHKDQLELSLCHHDYAKKIFKKNILKAIAHTQKAVIIRRNYQNEYPELLKKSLYNLGYFYKKDKNYIDAIETFESILSIKGEGLTNAKTHTNLGKLYSNIGDFNKSLLHYTKAERLYKKNNAYKYLFKNHLNLSHLYASMGRLAHEENILHHLQSADTIKKKILHTSVVLIDEMAIAQSLGNLYDEKKEYQKALVYHQQALNISLQTKDSSSISKSYSNIGITLHKSKKYKEALFHYNRAFAYAYTNTELKGAVFNNLGDHYLAQNMFCKAITYYQNAIDEIRSTTPDKIHLMNWQIDLGNAWIQFYRHSQEESYLHEALEHFKIADQLIDLIRFESTEFKSKLFWREKSNSLYMNAVHICYILGKTKKAFYFMEKNKALLLLEEITYEKAKKKANLPKNIETRESILRQRILSVEKQLQTIQDNTKSKTDILKDSLLIHKRMYENFIDTLENDYPTYYRYKQKTSVLSYDAHLQIQKKKEQLTLIYILNNDEGYGMLFSSEFNHFFKLSDVKKLLKTVTLFKQKLAQPFYKTQDFEAFYELSYELYQQLFPQLEATIFHQQKLTIIPDYYLQQIPFEALRTSLHNKEGYLLEQCEIRYAYSSSFLALNNEISRNAPKNFISFAPITFPELTLPDLLFSDKEIAYPLSIYKGDSYKKNRATKQNFINTANNYKIIHLTTHADLGKTSPWIAFYDEKLFLEELYTTKNQADLVVLSACNTSKGDLKKGEGIMSLARGFFSTGTKSVLSTLWSVNEKATGELIFDFYKNLVSGNTKSKSLQQAKLSYLKNHSGVEKSPYYWAAPILIGNSSTIDLHQTPSNWLSICSYLFAILLFSFVLYFFFQKNKKKML